VNISYEEKRIILMALNYFIDEVGFPDSVLKQKANEAKEIAKKFRR